MGIYVQSLYVELIHFFIQFVKCFISLRKSLLISNECFFLLNFIDGFFARYSLTSSTLSNIFNICWSSASIMYSWLSIVVPLALKKLSLNYGIRILFFLQNLVFASSESISIVLCICLIPTFSNMFP